jgi:hypothetical protein
VKVVRRVVCTGSNAADSVEDGDPETEYLALVENSSLLALTAGVVNDSTEDVVEVRVPATVPEAARAEAVVGVPGALGAGRLEVEVVMRAGVLAGGAGEEAGRGGGLLDDETSVSDREVWLVRDASSSVVSAAPGGPFWFPPGPGGPFLFPSRPGAFVFAGSRTARAFWKDGGFVNL